MTNPASLQGIDPMPGGLDIWAFDHARSHELLTLRANQLGAKFVFRILDPISADLQGWLLDHQRSHNDLAQFTGFNNADLQTVDFQDPRQVQSWLEIDAQEHATFALALGIAA